MRPLLPPPLLSPDFPVARFGIALPAELAGGVVAIGNFDGVHHGHRAVINKARSIAAAASLPAVVMTFEPHPRAFFRPDLALFRLTDAETKVRLIASLGVAGVAIAGFDKAFAALTAEDFVSHVLLAWLGARVVVTGEDFRFGAGRAGDTALLAHLGRRHGFDAQAVAPVGDGEPFSSTAIRQALGRGDVSHAAGLLGHCWFVRAEVRHGEKRGRELGYPTANLALDPACGLAHGIYAVQVGIAGIWHAGVASFGRRPTFDNGAPLLEVHVFDFAGDLYGQAIDVAFVGYLRPEAKFASIEALITQMDADSRAARALVGAG